ncbi:hypothetical protein DEA98_10290 [Brucella pseudogrignonensis]|nr:hypothetical protein [Brucella pseudogrignonensis]
MKIRCIDFETTGKIEEREKGKPVGICEFGFADVDGSTGAVSKPVSSLINCGIAMPPEARAIHHISDEDVSESPAPDFAFKSLMDGMEPGDVFCAHNAAFEQAIFTGSTFPLDLHHAVSKASVGRRTGLQQPDAALLAWSGCRFRVASSGDAATPRRARRLRYGSHPVTDGQGQASIGPHSADQYTGSPENRGLHKGSLRQALVRHGPRIPRVVRRPSQGQPQPRDTAHRTSLAQQIDDVRHSIRIGTFR